MPEQLLLPHILEEAKGDIANSLAIMKKHKRITKESAKVLVWMLTQIQQDQKILKRYKLTRQDISRVTGRKANMARLMETIFDDLKDFGVYELRDGREYFILMNSVVSRPIDKDERFKFIEFKFNDELRNYLLVGKDYAGIKLSVAMCMKSHYSVFMYYIARSYLYSKTPIHTVTLDLLQLKDALGCYKQEGKKMVEMYKDSYQNFKDRVLNVIRDEFRDTPAIDIEFNYVGLIEGKKVTKIELCFNRKKESNVVKKTKKEVVFDQYDGPKLSTADVMALIEANPDGQLNI